MIVILFGGYLFFAFLYYVFRPSTASATEKARGVLEEQEKVQTISQKLLGSPLGYILIYQMQIIALILSNIAWSPEMPAWLIDILTFLGNLLSIDLSGLLSSPDCVSSMDPLTKWLVALALPWCLAALFVLWYGIARCFKKNDEVVVETILHSAVQVLLIGLFTTVVKTCFEIFDCTQAELDVNGDYTDPVLIMDPSYSCSVIGGYQFLAMCIFFIWAVLPFLIIGIQLTRYKWKDTLETKMVESSKFRIMYGWAVDKYRTEENAEDEFIEDKMIVCRDISFECIGRSSYYCCLCWAFNPYLWEIFNAVIKAAMAVASVTMYETNRTTTQVVTISVSLFLHILVRPYKNTTENVVVVLFCIVDLLGINASTSAFWQILFIVATFLMLIVVSVMAFKATRASIKEKKMNGLLNDENQYTPLEKKLLLPVFLCVWPLKRMAVLLCRLNKDVGEEGQRKAPHGTKILPREKSDEEDSLPRACTPRLGT